MNNPKDPKNLPPDDFSKTTPYIKTPKDDYPSSSAGSSRDDYASDWEKTNFNYSIPTPAAPSSSSNSPYSSQPPASDDDWGKTSVNINIPRGNESQHNDDFGKTFMPGQMPRQSSQPPSSGWDMTQANINISGHEDFGGGRGQQQQNDFGATVPLIQLPESERAKLLNQHQQTAQQAAEEKKDERKTTPAWVWFGGVAMFFLLIAAVIVGAFFLFSRNYGYDVLVKGALPNADVYVDGVRWNLTSKDGSYLLSGLSAGSHKIEIKHPQMTYEPEQVNGEDGSKTVEVVAKGRQVVENKPPPDDCANFKKGETAKAQKCADDALNKLGENFTVEELLRAMNLYIINFASGKFDIKPDDLKFLEKSAGYMKKLPPNVNIEVGGHTDNVGNDASNQKLSDNRANAVKTALIGFGVKREILESRGYGKNKPKPGNTNANEDEKFQNRRIEYTAIIR